MKRIKRMVSALLVLTMCLSMGLGTMTAGAASVSYGYNESVSSGTNYSTTVNSSSTTSISTDGVRGIGGTDDENGKNGYSFSWSSTNYYVGKTLTYNASYHSSNGLKMATSNSKIASVSAAYSKDGESASGKITFKKPGTVTIKLLNKKTGKTVASCKFTVKPYIKSLKFSSSTKSCEKGKSYTLNYTVTKYNGKKDTSSSFPSYVSVSASSSNSKVAKVTSTSKGKVKIKALKKGTATIKIKANDGSKKTASIKITVK